MRIYAYAAGLLGFATIASGGQTVSFETPLRPLQGEYTYAQGTVDEATVHFTVDRTLKFRFPDASLSASGTALKPDSQDLVTEYDYGDVNAALKEADREARRTKGSYDKLAAKYLAQMDRNNIHQIDCRVVARQMVEGLINSTAEASVDGKKRKIHQLVARPDNTDVALAGRQLETSTFIRDSSIVPGDIEPRFICRKTWVPHLTAECKNPSVCGDNAMCGNLVVKFNPQPQTAGVFKGKNAYVLNQSSCQSQEGRGTSYESCRLNLRIDACGMRYTLKADKGSRDTDPNVRGLADELKADIESQERELRHGTASTDPGTQEALSAPAQSAVDEAVVPPSPSPTSRAAF